MAPKHLEISHLAQNFFVRPLGCYYLSMRCNLHLKCINKQCNNTSRLLFHRYIYIYRWNTRISVSKTWYLYHARWTFPLSADKNDIMVTRFSKMAVLLFTKGSLLYYERQVWFNLKFRGKIYFVVIFYVKIKGSCPRAELPAGVLCIRCSSYIF